MSTPKQVDFMIVGEPKSGTTALAQFLNQHPDIAFPNHKEPHYFCSDHIEESDRFHDKQLYFHVRSDDQYHALFAGHEQVQLWGEASTGYLYSKEAAKNIHTYNPHAKIIIMLREPVSFLHSLHMQYVNETTEDETDFEAALAKEPERKTDWRGLSKNVRCPSYLYYSERVKYAEQVKRFFDLFPAEQILVIENEEFQKDNPGMYRQVLKFLGAASFTPDFQVVHGSKTPRFRALNNAMHNPKLKTALYKTFGSKRYTLLHKKVNKALLRPYQRVTMADETKQKLRQQCAPEVAKLSRLLKRDLTSRWGYDSPTEQ